jgi:hypothetical protein
MDAIGLPQLVFILAAILVIWNIYVHADGVRLMPVGPCTD